MEQGWQFQTDVCFYEGRKAPAISDRGQGAKGQGLGTAMGTRASFPYQLPMLRSADPLAGTWHRRCNQLR